MSKRKSESARVVDFFKNEPLDVVDAVLGIVRDMAKFRHEVEGNSGGSPEPTKRRKRLSKKSATAGALLDRMKATESGASDAKM